MAVIYFKWQDVRTVPPASTGSQGWARAWWAVSRVLWLKRAAPGTPAPHSAPTIARHSSTFLVFSKNHLIGGVLISEVRVSSWLLRFALLTSTAQDYLPKSKQNGLTLSRKCCRQAALSTDLCPRGVGTGGWAHTAAENTRILFI